MYSWIALIAGLVVSLSLSGMVARGFEVREAKSKPKPSTNEPRLIEFAIVAVIITIVAGLAIPNLLRSRIAANESAAVGELRTINTAIVTYKTLYGVYPRSIEALGPPAKGAPSPEAAGLLDAKLARGSGLGFSFKYLPETNEIIARPLIGNSALRFAVSNVPEQHQPKQ